LILFGDKKINFYSYKEVLELLDEIENNQWLDASLSPADKEKY